MPGELTNLIAEAGGDLRVLSSETALDVLARIEEEPGLGALLRYLQHHPSAYVRSKVALLLGRANPDLRNIRRLMAVSDGRSRANAIESLWGSTDPAILELFRESSNDEYGRVAINALIGLVRAGDRGAYQCLKRWTQADDPVRRAGALWAIRELGEEPVQRSGQPAGEGVHPAHCQGADEPAPARQLAEWFPGTGTAIEEAALHVLEEMCFVTGIESNAPEQGAPAQGPGGWMTAQVEFRGSVAREWGWSGRCLVQMADTCARMLAANFAGAADAGAIDMQEIIEFVCEFVNMVCGGTIARLNSAAVAVFASPHLLWDWPASLDASVHAERWLDIGGDFIRLGFEAKSGGASSLRIDSN